MAHENYSHCFHANKIWYKKWDSYYLEFFKDNKVARSWLGTIPIIENKLYKTSN